MTELQILQRISHHHCIELVASYTDPRFFGLLMSPVADCNLSIFYKDVLGSEENKTILRRFFGCLAHALSFLHQSKIRHRDIKPENILVKGSEVYLADFGISLDWENLTRSTTTADSAKTWTYCAPEVANQQKRNSSSDIWSLGCVFLEMLTTLKDLPVQDL
ncbi:kinase-like protein, partial [Setomelanomma holmii]